ncbi:hypothetical protein KAI87_09450 [Myxococcota bacterium]|nr:hypothetical protein [Myxococcota bacterium]
MTSFVLVLQLSSVILSGGVSASASNYYTPYGPVSLDNAPAMVAVESSDRLAVE